MRKPGSAEYNVLGREGEHKKIGYTEEFKAWLADHPGAIRDAVDVIEQMMEKDNFHHHDFSGGYDEEEDIYYGDERPIEIGKTKKSKVAKVRYMQLSPQAATFRVTVDKKNFFVKRQDPSYDADQGGYNELVATSNAAKAFANLNWVRVIKPKLAYTDSRTGMRYFVSEWEKNGIRLDDYFRRRLKLHPDEVRLPEIKKITKDPKIIRLYQRYERIKERLMNYFDGASHNMFYDEANDQIVLFDLNDSDLDFD